MMRSLRFILISTIVCLGIASKKMEPGANRQKKILSLFNIVQFNNDQCTGSGGVLGTCFTANECILRRGIAKGNCAAGFGTCCSFQISTCGGSVSQNNTLIQNENFPTGTATNRMCSFSIVNAPGATNICQIRLDFINTDIDQPNIMGACVTDMLTVMTSPATVNYPTLCGDLSGQHMYIDVVRGSVGTVANVDIKTQTAIRNRLFNIRTSYIECDNPSRPPQGCRQYFEGPVTQIQSYNFGGLHLQSQDISYCFRRENGRCSFTVRQSTVTGAGDAFKLPQKAAPMEEVQTDCTISFVQFPILSAVGGDKRCEGVFGLVATDTLPSNVPSQPVNPFRVLFFTNAMDQFQGTGFDLIVTQNPC